MRPWGPWLTTAIYLAGHAIEVFGALIIVTGIAWLILIRVRRLIAEINRQRVATTPWMLTSLATSAEELTAVRLRNETRNYRGPEVGGLCCRLDDTDARHSDCVSTQEPIGISIRCPFD